MSLFLLLFLCATFSDAYAQDTMHNKNTQPSIQDILNPNDSQAGNIPNTPSAYANEYFKTCMQKGSLALDEFQTEIMCGCTSAKMAQTLTVDEFKVLDQNTTEGQQVRGKALAHAYAPCMPDIIKTKTTDDCLVSPKVYGLSRADKGKVCECFSSRFSDYIIRSAPTMIVQHMEHHPMSMNPLEHFITQTSYVSLEKTFMGQCRYEALHKTNR